jgi:hypothetical protein
VTHSTLLNKRKQAKQPIKTSRARRKNGAKAVHPSAATRKRLQELLYQVGLVRGELPDFFEAYSGVLAAASRSGPRYVAGRGKSVLIPDAITTEEALEQSLQICLEDQEELAQYIDGRRKDEKRPPGAPWYWYIFIREAREKLRKLAKGEPIISVGAPIRKDSTGLFQVDRDYFGEAIDGLDSRLLRECARDDCQKIFIAKHVKSKCCNTKCDNIMRNRLLRFLNSKGFLAGVKLKPKDRAVRDDLEREWRHRNNYPKFIESQN